MVISIAHVMKKQEVKIDFRTCSVLAKTICKLGLAAVFGMLSLLKSWGSMSMTVLDIDIQNCDNFIAHVMKKQEVKIDFCTCSVLAKTICKLLSMCRSQS